MHPSIPLLIASLCGAATAYVLCRLFWQLAFRRFPWHSRSREIHGLADISAVWASSLLFFAAIFFYESRFRPWVNRRFGNGAALLALLLASIALLGFALWVNSMQRKQRDAE